MQTFEGKMTVISGDRYEVGVVKINDDYLEDLLFNYDGKRVKLTIEEITPESESEETIQIKLKKIVANDEACASLGINSWCVAEGADGDEWVTVSLEKAKILGLV